MKTYTLTYTKTGEQEQITKEQLLHIRNNEVTAPNGVWYHEDDSLTMITTMGTVKVTPNK